MSDETVRFSVLCSMFQAMIRSKSSSMKRKHFRTFLDHVYKSREYFSVIRLVLPSFDRERGTYGLKESTLATCLIDALGMSRESEDAVRLINWRKGGTRVGHNVGNFALVAFEILQARQGLGSTGLTIKELNHLLDRLASSEKREGKTAVLSEIINKTNAQEMKWILMITLKDLKLGVSEKTIFHEFHPDAEDLFNVTCDLKLICEKLKDRTQRNKRQDIEVGKAVRPQLALRVSDVNTAWKKFHGKQVVAECKFDGERIQIHKNGPELHFFSRNFLDHSEYCPGMSDVIRNNIKANRVILDGEMLVWDTSTGRFAEFGSNQEIAKACKDGLQGDRQLCYVAFDILYVGDTSVIHQSLKERHELLRNVVKPMKGRLEILVPNGGLNSSHVPGEPCWSLIVYNVGEVEKFFKETVENRDEGIVLKDIGSKWEPSDRSGKWLKLKPDYVHAGSDLDVLIIGGYFGSGRGGGEVSQFLVGIGERSTPAAHPTRFISFCRVGSGISDDDLDVLVSKLKPYFRRNENSKKVPNFYVVTNHSKERPDVWIDNPEKSVILSINSDIRTIKSEVFASPYGLRFPRIQKVRYDKPWYECLDVKSFVELVQTSNGNVRQVIGASGPDRLPKQRRSSAKSERRTVNVPAHFVQTDVSAVKEESLLFTNMMFYFVNVPPTHSLDFFHKLVVENGGTFSMNLNDSVTHCIAAEKKGIRYQAAAGRGDVIHYSWVLDCCLHKRLLHLQPKHFLLLSESSKEKLQEEVDVYGDFYFSDLDMTDMKRLFDNISTFDRPSTLDHWKKYYPSGKWSLFWGCCIYFYQPTQSIDPDDKTILELASRRMMVEFSVYGGKVGRNVSEATHLLVLSLDDFHLDFEKILDSFPDSVANILRSTTLHVISYRWLEDSLMEHRRMEESVYNLRPQNMERSSSRVELLLPAATGNNESTSLTTSQLKMGGKRTEPVQLYDKRRATKRAHVTKPVKIDDAHESNDSDDATEGPDRFERKAYKHGGTASELHAKAGTRKQAVWVPPRRTSKRRVHLQVDRAEDNNDELKNDSYLDDDRRNEGGYQRRKEESDSVKINEESRRVAAQDAMESSIADEMGLVKRGDQKHLLDKSESNPVLSRRETMNDGLPPALTRAETTSDPLQALLFQMVPGLHRPKRDEGTSLAREDVQNAAANSAPSERKKVSYKDLVGSLLKD